MRRFIRQWLGLALTALVLCAGLAQAAAVPLPAQLPIRPQDVLGPDGSIDIHAILKLFGDGKEAREFREVVDKLIDVAQNIDVTKVTLPEDATRTIPEMVRNNGYPCEEHTVNTTDGYRLKVFRIPYGRNSTIGGKPVLLSHGLLDSAGSWVVNGPGKSLPYTLADAGYDVWLGNIRANKYGEEHDEYGSYDHELWDVSFDEQGKVDVPQTIDYILQASNHTKVAVVGHSQGCLQLFAALHFHPSLADKISVFAALSPAGYFYHLTNFLVKTAANLYLAELLELFGMMKFIRLAEFVEDMIPYVCHTAPDLTEKLLSLLVGSNPGEIPADRLGVMCAQVGWTSVQNMVHWAQLVRNEELALHDYGWYKNERVYGQRSPPVYDLSKIPSLPIAVFYGTNDELVTPGDAKQMIEDLPEANIVFTKEIPNYAHLDFTWGGSADINIYEDTLNLIKRYH